MGESKKRVSQKGILKAGWDFIWHSNSVWSWLANIVLAFIFIKFIFYPGLGVLFNTSYPLVAVVSGSMEHAYSPKFDSAGDLIVEDGEVTYTFCKEQFKRDVRMINFRDFEDYDKFWDVCGTWYDTRNITKDEFSKFLFKNGFNKGDIIFIYGSEPKNLKIGDVIVFQRGFRPDPIIHRIVDYKIVDGKYYFTTKGDHNSASGGVDLNIPENIVLGKGVFRVPYFGWIKIWFVDLIEWISQSRG